LRQAQQELYHVSAFGVDAETPRAAEFARRYRKAFQEDPDADAAVAYEGLKLLFEAARRSKDNLTPQQVRGERLQLRDSPGLAGPLSFTPGRHLRRPAFVLRVDDGGAKVVQRYPPDP